MYTRSLCVYYDVYVYTAISMCILQSLCAYYNLYVYTTICMCILQSLCVHYDLYVYTMISKIFLPHSQLPIWGTFVSHQTLFCIGCRHISVDFSAPSILPPWVRVPSTPSMFFQFISFKLDICHLNWNVKKSKKRQGMAHLKNLVLHPGRQAGSSLPSDVRHSARRSPSPGLPTIWQLASPAWKTNETGLKPVW